MHGNYAALDETDMSYYSSGMHLPERATVDSQVHPAPRAFAYFLNWISQSRSTRVLY